MLIFPKKPKFTKTFSNKKQISKTINKRLSPQLGNFCLIAKETGFLTNFQVESLRRLLRRSFKRRCQIFFRFLPNIPITKKPSDTRLGRGKGKLKYWCCIVNPGDIIVEFKTSHKQFISQFFKNAHLKLPIKTFFYDRQKRWIL